MLLFPLLRNILTRVAGPGSDSPDSNSILQKKIKSGSDLLKTDPTLEKITERNVSNDSTENRIQYYECSNPDSGADQNIQIRIRNPDLNSYNETMTTWHGTHYLVNIQEILHIR